MNIFSSHSLRLFYGVWLSTLFLWSVPAFAQSSAPPLTTITNPTPAANDVFGDSVAAMGTDRFLVGAEGAGSGGEAYLYRQNGTLLTTFSVLDSALGGFGYGLAAVGNDRVLIGGYSYFTNSLQVGRAYLFRTNGALQTTFTNPAPATVQAFGISVAAMGADRVLIGGVPDVNKPAPYPGGVFLFRTNGTLLATFNNPTPTVPGTFGIAIATVGNHRVLIGSPGDNTGATQAGVAHLFSTNGTRLITFTNPHPIASDNFGTAVAAVGNERVLISAIDYGAARNGGAAYLFSTNGTLLAAFTNPIPTVSDYFGWSVAAVGSSRVLIGAYRDGTGAVGSGAAYLFSTNGTLLNVFTNPTPAVSDSFGWSVAAIGTDRVIIGALFDNTGGADAGAAYLFDLPYPPLRIVKNAESVSVKWSTLETGLILQQTDTLGNPTLWSNATNAASITGQTNLVQQSTSNATTNRFYRLRRP